MTNQELAEELNKSISKSFESQKVCWLFTDNMLGEHMQLTNKFSSGKWATWHRFESRTKIKRKSLNFEFLS